MFIRLSIIYYRGLPADFRLYNKTTTFFTCFEMCWCWKWGMLGWETGLQSDPQPPTPFIPSHWNTDQSPSPRNSEKPKYDQDDYCCPKRSLIHQQVHGRCTIMRQQSLIDSTLLWEMIITHKEFEVDLSFKLNRNLAENKVNGGIWNIPDGAFEYSYFQA